MVNEYDSVSSCLLKETHSFWFLILIKNIFAYPLRSQRWSCPWCPAVECRGRTGASASPRHSNLDPPPTWEHVKDMFEMTRWLRVDYWKRSTDRSTSADSVTPLLGFLAFVVGASPGVSPCLAFGQVQVRQEGGQRALDLVWFPAQSVLSGAVVRALAVEADVIGWGEKKSGMRKWITKQQIRRK